MECPICYEVVPDKDCQKTQCGHYFCKECLNKCKETSTRCPICRDFLFTYKNLTKKAHRYIKRLNALAEKMIELQRNDYNKDDLHDTDIEVVFDLKSMCHRLLHHTYMAKLFYINFAPFKEDGEIRFVDSDLLRDKFPKKYKIGVIYKILSDEDEVEDFSCVFFLPNGSCWMFAADLTESLPFPTIRIENLYFNFEFGVLRMGYNIDPKTKKIEKRKDCDCSSCSNGTLRDRSVCQGQFH